LLFKNLVNLSIQRIMVQTIAAMKNFSTREWHNRDATQYKSSLHKK